MKSQEGPRDAIARYILLKLEDRMVVSHDLETHRRQNRLEIGRQRRILSTSSPCNLPQMAGSIVVIPDPPSSSSSGSSICSGLSFVVESSICECAIRSGSLYNETTNSKSSGSNGNPWQMGDKRIDRSWCAAQWGMRLEISQDSAMRMNFHERCVYGDVPYHDLFGLQGCDGNSPSLLKSRPGMQILDVCLKARFASNSPKYAHALLSESTEHAQIL